MRCSSCGSENREDRKFCAGCGAALIVACAACGANNQPGERFCGECGKPLAEAAKEPTPREPRSYTPKHLAEKILSSRGALEGERKQVTVLFADVQGSMALAEQNRSRGVARHPRLFLPDPFRRRSPLRGAVNQYTGWQRGGLPHRSRSRLTRPCSTISKSVHALVPSASPTTRFTASPSTGIVTCPVRRPSRNGFRHCSAGLSFTGP